MAYNAPRDMGLISSPVTFYCTTTRPDFGHSDFLKQSLLCLKGKAFSCSELVNDLQVCLAQKIFIGDYINDVVTEHNHK